VVSLVVSKLFIELLAVWIGKDISVDSASSILEALSSKIMELVSPMALHN
jgi:hypothetical protein